MKMEKQKMQTETEAGIELGTKVNIITKINVKDSVQMHIKIDNQRHRT